MSGPPVPLHDTMGALFIGVMIANILLGISIVQAFYYYRHQNDSWSLKSLVAAVILCDTIHQAMITHTVYTYLITNWGNVAILGKIVPSLLTENVPNSLTALLVQGFLTVRVWRLSNGNILLTGVTALLVLAEYAAITAFTIISLQFDTFAQLVTLKPLSLSVNLLAAAGDVLIAGALCALLHRSRTGFRRSDTIINKLILFAVNTGLLTSLCAVASFISYMAAPNTFIYITFYFSIGRLYTNSLLATLNARKMIRASGNHSSITDKMTLSLRDLGKNGTTSTTHPTNISININTTKEYVTDLIGQEKDHDTDKIEYLQASDSNGASAGFDNKNDKV